MPVSHRYHRGSPRSFVLWAGSVAWLLASSCLLSPTTAQEPAAPQDAAAPDSTAQEPATREPATQEPAAPEQPALKFSFQKQAWPDVLNWFARQADLSLVMNETPPGNFSFIDNKPYSPSQAIDLLNSVLLTKNFTLVRKDKMLLVLNISDGIPYDLVPRIERDQLPECGRFELVTLSIPLEGRPIEAVQNELNPLLGPLGRLVPLPATGQVLITETAGKMQTIDALIQSIPKPQKPSQPERKPDPPPQLLQTYQVTDLDLQSTSEVLEKAVGGIRSTVDLPSNQIFIFATESQHENIRTILGQLRANPQPTPAVVQTYRYRTNQPQRLVDQLQTVVPPALLQIDAPSQRLIVIATADQHTRLQQAIESIEGATSETSLQLQSYPVPKSAQASATAAIQKMVPGVSITPQSDSDALLVIASAEEHQQLTEVLRQLQSAGVTTQNQDRVLATYPLKEADPALVSQVLKSLLPQVQIDIDLSQQRLIVLAEPEQQLQISTWIQQLDSAESPADKNGIHTYPLQNVDAAVALTAVQKLVPDLTLSLDATTGNLIAWGRDSDHKRLATLLKQLDGETGGDEKTMRVYDAGQQDARDISRIIEQIAPRALISSDRRSPGIAVWASPGEHAKIAPAMEQLSLLENKEDRVLETLPTVHTGAVVAAGLLRGVAPEAAFFPSKDDRSLFAFAAQADQRKVQSIMQQLETSNADATTDQLKTYSFSRPTLVAGRALLEARFPDSQLMDESTDEQWLVWASAETHGQINEMLTQLQQSLPADAEDRLQVYDLENLSVVDAKTAVSAVVGPVTYLESSTENQLRIWAPGRQHAQITELLQQLSTQLTQSAVPRPLQIYSIDPSIDIAIVLESLSPELLQGAEVIPNLPRNALLVRAGADKQTEIKTAIDEFVAALPEKIAPIPVVYSLKSVAPTTAQTLLTTLVPDATYAIDIENNNIAATALPEQHQQIADAIRQIDVATDSPLETRAYRVPFGYATAIQSSLVPMYPQAKISTDFTGSVLVIAAQPQQHAAIDRIIQDILLGSADNAITKVYTLQSANPNSALAVVKQILPRSQGTVDLETRSMVVTASDTEHRRIEDLLQQIEASGQDRTPQVYRLRNSNPRAVQEALETSIPRATITVDRSSGMLIATASAEDQVRIQATIKQLESSENEGLTTKAYTLTSADPRAAESALESLLPSVRFAADTDSGLLLATASEDQHSRIAEVVLQMESSDTDRLHARAIEIGGGNSERLYAMLSRMYRWDDKVRFTYESTSGTIMFVGPKRQEDAVMELVDQWNQVVRKELPRDVQVYDLAELDGDAVVDSMDELFEEQSPKPDLQIQWYTNKLIAVATPEQHLVIDSTLKQIRGQERRLEVFTLQVNAPQTVEDAIDQMFVDLPVGSSPSINSSPETQQLFIRASDPQLQDIRNLLVKLGEPESVLRGTGDGLGATPLPNANSQGVGNLRMIATPASPELLQQLELIWPQISSHPLQIMRPVPLDSQSPDRSAAPRDQPQDPSGLPRVAPEKAAPEKAVPDALPGAASAAEPESEGSFQSQPEPLEPLDSPVPEPASGDRIPTGLPLSVNPEAFESASGSATDTIETGTGTGNPPAQDLQEAKPVQENTLDNARTPIVLIPNNQQIAIASQDGASVETMEALLKILSQQLTDQNKIELAGNFTVFQLKNAGADEISEMVSRLFQQITRSQSRDRGDRREQSRVSIVPDQRLNALIVYGPPNDRRTIGSLIEILDISEIPLAANRGNQARIVAVANVQADRILEVLESVYRTQLRPDQPPRLQIPAGVSVDVAVALREINAEAIAPLLTLEVDQATNSIIVLASERLGSEVEALIQRLDQQHKDGNTRSFKVIALEKTNLERIDNALRRLLQQDGVRRRRD